MQLYFIRHAATSQNLSGTMARNYADTPIIPFNPSEWYSTIEPNISYRSLADIVLLSSPALRCMQTIETLFGSMSMIMDTLDTLAEFDCGGLGDKKFWEISQDEFEQCVSLSSSDMEDRIDQLLDELNEKYPSPNTCCILVSHGMLIRYLYHYLNGNKGISPYDVINSRGFKFANLDMLKYDTHDGRVSVFNYKPPIQHI